MTTALIYKDLLALSPLLILLTTSLVHLLVEAFCKHKPAMAITLTGLGLALYAACQGFSSTNPLLTPWITFDTLAQFFNIFFISVGVATTLISFNRSGDYHFFLVASLFGLLLIGSAADFLTLFLGLETLSIALYVLCGYMKNWTASSESAFKYFILGSISTGFLLFGIALIYGATGTTNFGALAKVHALANPEQMLFVGGIALVSFGFLFKAAAVPLHVWAPDVYAGASTSVTAFMAVGTKAGAFAALIRLFLFTFKELDPLWNQAIAILTYATLIYANFVALRQFELRRFFAYSGISHAGFLLIPLVAGGPEAASSMLFYLVVYALATLGAFAVLSATDDTSEGINLKDLKGLFHTSPVLASILILCVLTLGGIPPTVGFFAKFYLLKVAFTAGYYGLVVVGLLTTILSAFYYLRIAAVLFSEAPAEKRVARWPLPTAICAAGSFAAIIALSITPESLIQLFR